MELDFLNNVANSDFATSFIPFLITYIFSRFASAFWTNSSNSFGANEFAKWGLSINPLPRLHTNALGGIMYPVLLSAKYDSIGRKDFAKLIMSFMRSPSICGTTLTFTSLHLRTCKRIIIEIVPSLLLLVHLQQNQLSCFQLEESSTFPGLSKHRRPPSYFLLQLRVHVKWFLLHCLPCVSFFINDY